MIRSRAPRAHAIGLATAIVLVSIALMALLSFNTTMTTTTTTKPKTSAKRSTPRSSPPPHTSRRSSRAISRKASDGKHQDLREGDLKKKDDTKEEEGLSDDEDDMPSWKGFRQITNRILGGDGAVNEIDEQEDIKGNGVKDTKSRQDQEHTTDFSPRNRHRIRSPKNGNRSLSGKTTDQTSFVALQEERSPPRMRRESLYTPVFLPPTPAALALYNNLLLALSFADEQINAVDDNELSFSDHSAYEKKAEEIEKKDVRVMSVGPPSRNDDEDDDDRDRDSSSNDGHNKDGINTTIATATTTTTTASTSTSASTSAFLVLVYPAVLYVDRRSPSLPLSFMIRGENDDDEEEGPPHHRHQGQSSIGSVVGGEQCWLRTLLGAVEAEEIREKEEDRVRKVTSGAPLGSERKSGREEGNEQHQPTLMSANNNKSHNSITVFDLVDRIVCQNHHHRNYHSNAVKEENSGDNNNKLIGTDGVASSSSSSSSSNSSNPPLSPPRALPTVVSSIINRLPSRGQFGRYESTSLALYGLPHTLSAQPQHKKKSRWEEDLASRLWPVTSVDDAPTSARAQSAIDLGGREEAFKSPPPLERNSTGGKSHLLHVHGSDSVFSHLLVGYPPLSTYSNYIPSYSYSYASLRGYENTYASSVLNEFPFLQQLACPPPPSTTCTINISLPFIGQKNSASLPCPSSYSIVVRGNSLFIVVPRRSNPIAQTCLSSPPSRDLAGRPVAPPSSSSDPTNANERVFEKSIGLPRRKIRPFRPFTCASNTIAAQPSALVASVPWNSDQIAEQPVENLNSAVDKSATPGEEVQKKNEKTSDEEQTPPATVVTVGGGDGVIGGGGSAALDNDHDEYVPAPASVLTRITLGTNSDSTEGGENAIDRAEIMYANKNSTEEKDKDLHTSLKQAITRNIRSFRHYFRESFLEAEKWAELKSKRRQRGKAARSGKKEWEKEQGEDSIVPLLGPLSTPEGPAVLRSTCGAWSEPDEANGGYVRWSPAAGNCTQRLRVGLGDDSMMEAAEQPLTQSKGNGEVVETETGEENAASESSSSGETPKGNGSGSIGSHHYSLNSMHLLDDYPVEAYRELLGGLLQSVTGLGIGTRSDRYLWGHAENDADAKKRGGDSSGVGGVKGIVPVGRDDQNVQHDRHRARLRAKIKTSKEGMTAVLADGMRGFIKRKLEAEHLARLRETMKKKGARNAKQEGEEKGMKRPRHSDSSVPDVLHPSKSTFSDHQHISFLFWGDSTIRGAFCATFRHLMANLPSARSRETCDAGGIHGLPHGTRTISAFLPTDTTLREWSSRQRSEAPTGDNENENEEQIAMKVRAAFSRRILHFFATTPIRLTVTLTFFSSPYFGEELATQTLHSTTGVGVEELLVRYFPPTAVTMIRSDRAAEAEARLRSDQQSRHLDLGHRKLPPLAQKGLHTSLDDVAVLSSSSSSSASPTSFENLVEVQREELYKEMGRGAATGGPPRPIPLPSFVYCGKGMWDGLRVTSGLPDERLYMSPNQLSLGLGATEHHYDNRDSQGDQLEKQEVPPLNPLFSATHVPLRSGATVKNNQKHNPSLLEHSLLYERVVAEAFVSLRTLFPYAALTLQGAQHVVPPLLYEKTGFTFCTATFVKGYWRRRLFAAARLFNGFTRWKKVRERGREENQRLLENIKLEPTKAAFKGPTINDEVNNMNTPPLFYVDYDELTSTMGRQFFTRGDGVHLNHPLLDAMIGLTAADVGVQMLQLQLPPPPVNHKKNDEVLRQVQQRQQQLTQWTLQPSGLSPRDLWTLLYQGSDPLLAHRLYVYEPRDKGKEEKEQTTAEDTASSTLSATDGERRRLLSSHTLKRPRALRRSISLVFISTDRTAVKNPKIGSVEEVENEKSTSAAASSLARRQALISRTFPPHLPTSAAHLPYPTPKCTSIASEYMLGRPGAVKLGLISGHLGIVMSGTIPRAPAPAEAADFDLQNLLPPPLSSSNSFDAEKKEPPSSSSSSYSAALNANHYDDYKRQYKAYISGTHIARRWFATVSSPEPSEHLLLITARMTNDTSKIERQTGETSKSYLYVELSKNTRSGEEEMGELYVPSNAPNPAHREKSEGARKEREGAEKESDQKIKRQNYAARLKDLVKGTTRFAFRSLFDVLSPFEYSEETEESEEHRGHQRALSTRFTHRSPAATLQRMWVERAVLAENIFEFLVLPAMERFSSAGVGGNNKVPSFAFASSNPIVNAESGKENSETDTNAEGPSSVNSNLDDSERAATIISSSVNAKEEMLACASVNILVVFSSSRSSGFLPTDIQFVLEFRDRGRNRKMPHAQTAAEEAVGGYLRLCYGRDFQFPERPEDASADSAMDLPFVDIVIDEQKTAQHVTGHAKRNLMRRKGRGDIGGGDIPKQKINITRFIKDLVRPAALRFASQLELLFLTAVAEASVPQFTTGGELGRLGAEKLVFTPKAKGTSSKKKKGKRGRRR